LQTSTALSFADSYETDFSKVFAPKKPIRNNRHKSGAGYFSTKHGIDCLNYEIEKFLSYLVFGASSFETGKNVLILLVF